MHRDLAATCAVLRPLLRIADPGLARPAVSQWSIAQHLEHIIQVNQAICARNASDSPGDPDALPIRFIAHVVMLTRHIPRGRGTSPAAMLPQTTSDPHILTKVAAHLAALEVQADTINAALARPGRFNHPVFGGLDRRQWLHFVHIHTLHHAKIIRDIR